MSFQGISDLMDVIFPCGKDTIMNVFNESVEKIISPIEDVYTVIMINKP